MHKQRPLHIVPMGKHVGKVLEKISSNDIRKMWSYWSQNLTHHSFFEVLNSEYLYREVEDLATISRMVPTKKNRGRGKVRFENRVSVECDKCKDKRVKFERNKNKKNKCKCGGLFVVTGLIPAELTKEEKRKQARAKQGVSMVYFIADEREVYVKIGRSIDPEGRMSELQVSQPSKLKIVVTFPEDNIVNEKSLHRKFSHLSVRGEWFSFSTEIRSFINTLRSVADLAARA